jgi:parallel beta-helix repeat protein
MIHVGGGTYETGPLWLKSKLTIDFEPDVIVKAWSIIDPCSPDTQDVDDPDSFAHTHRRLFNAKNESHIAINGDDTIFQMRKDEYPVTVEFDAYTDVDLDANTITITDHKFFNGHYVKYYNQGGTSIVPLVDNTTYSVIKVDSDTIKLASSKANAKAGININLTSKPTSSENHKLDITDDQRHVIILSESKDIDISGATCQDAGGDGIILWGSGSGEGHPACEDITIKDVRFKDNVRCGFIASSVDGLTIQDCNIMGSGYIGMEFEAHANSDILKNIDVNDVTISDSVSNGLSVACADLDDDNDINITCENIDIKDSGKNGITVTYVWDDGPDGLIKFKNVTVDNTYEHGTSLYMKSSLKAYVSFEDCVWKNIGSDENKRIIGIHIAPSSPTQMQEPGGVEFINCQVFDNEDRPAIEAYTWSSQSKELYDVHGDIYVDNPNRTGPLYDWIGSTLHDVTLRVHDVSVGSCKAHNTSRSVDDMCFATVQAAIDDVNDFDEIEVMPGTHYETLDFKGEPFTLRSTRPYKWDTVVSTVIDANDVDDGVTLDTAEDANSILEGLTIIGGNSYGVYCSSSTPVISKCIIRDNDNGINCSSATPTIKNSMIYDNAVGIEFASAASAATVSNNTIVYNTQQGIYVSSGTAPTVANCIFWGNDANDLDSCSATYSCIEDGDPGTGNISSDPDFVDAVNDDYHLQFSSPCIDVGDSGGTYTGQVDIDGDNRVIDIAGKGDGTVDVDMGADEYDPNGLS